VKCENVTFTASGMLLVTADCEWLGLTSCICNHSYNRITESMDRLTELQKMLHIYKNVHSVYEAQSFSDSNLGQEILGDLFSMCFSWSW